MDKLIRKIELTRARGEDARRLLRQEWLVTNGWGGYASGTICGTATWRYHGYLIAALPSPYGRCVMLNHLAEYFRLPGDQVIQIGGEELSRADEMKDTENYITEFRLENQLPIWRYECQGIVLEKHVLLLYGQNTVHITYRMLSGPDQVLFELRPAVHFRSHEHAVSKSLREQYTVSIQGERFEVSSSNPSPVLRLAPRGYQVRFLYDGGSIREHFFYKEAERGYESRGCLWSPGYFQAQLRPGGGFTLIGSTESWNTLEALEPEEALKYYHQRRRRLVAAADPKAREGPPAELVLAADQFIINPVGRLEDAARAHAAGDEVRTVIAGYHWFTDWGRDTMISLEGLTLATRRFTEAGWILRTFAHYIRDGLIPNLFPEGKNQGLYHTADATLWFFHALDRYLGYTGDRATLQHMLPKLVEIADYHLRGTRFGIGVDSADGLLRQGENGYQLTWMDAKVEDWVVTPRRGKTVEINALWYNALRLLERWLREEQSEEEARRFARLAEQVRDSFNHRFWYPDGKYLYDLVDGEAGNDSACRPNQILALALPQPVLDEKYWQPVLEIVRQRLLTPVGLRSLSPAHPDYKPKYFGDLRARDAAYHQGTVWAWLIGPFIDAWLRVKPEDRAGARQLLEGFRPHLNEACIGSISEIFDAEPPFSPRGCVAQAWSVAEVLRSWIKTAE